MDELLDDPCNDLDETLTPLVTGWCRRWCPQADPEQVRPQMLVRLQKRLNEFAPVSFRRWVLTQGRQGWLDLRDEFGASPRFAALWRTAALQDLLERLHVEMDWQLHEEAAQRVRERVGAGAWMAYQLTVLEGYPCRETADELNTTAETVAATAADVKHLLGIEAGHLERRLDALLSLLAAESSEHGIQVQTK